MTITSIKGFKDILPDETPLWRVAEEKAARVMDAFGYNNIRIPVLERTELFARGIGTDTDIVEKEMYTFHDRNDESLTLRPEATAGIVRLLMEHKLTGDGRPLKTWIIGPMFRYENPQKGRQRQFHQLDVEIFNDPSPHADAELIVVLDHFLAEMGLSSVVMKINSLGCPDCRPGYKDTLREFLKSRKDLLCGDCRRRMDANPLRVLDCKVPTCQEAVLDAPALLDVVCPVCREHFETVQDDLGRAGVVFEVNNRLVRGLDYYSRTTFEAQTGDLGAQNAVAGGGRYDGLAETLGGPHIPASGWALGLERLVMLLAQKEAVEAKGPDLFIAALDEAAVRAAFPLLQELRRLGVFADMEYQPGSLKSRMRRAGKLGAKKVLILGPEELERQTGVLRDMETKEQIDLPLADAARRFAEMSAK